MVPQAAHRGGELGLVGRHGAALTGRHDLPGVERQAREQPERAAGRSAIASPEGARGVLDEDDVLRHSGLELLPGDGPAEEVDGEHGPRPPGHRLGDELGRTTNVSGSTSTSIACAPQSSTAFAVAGNV